MALLRRKEREYAFMMIFEALFHEGEDSSELFERILENTDDPEVRENQYIRNIFFGVAEKKEELNGIISSLSPARKLSRISKVSLALLQLALFEIYHVEAIAESVSINEAVELAKIYDDDKAPSFINGLLGNAVREKNGEAKK
jgi:N utilization substance protein B